MQEGDAEKYEKIYDQRFCCFDNNNLIHSFFPINYIGIIPQTSDFELTTEIPRLTYDSGEIIHISATLKNKTLRSYVVSHSFKIISVSYVKSGTDKENTVVPAISKSSYIGPGQSFSIGEKLIISESGQYTIYVDAVIWIADAPYRKRGFANQILDMIIEYSKKNQINRLWLNSSEQGKRLYAQRGFVNKENEMELF